MTHHGPRTTRLGPELGIILLAALCLAAGWLAGTHVAGQARQCVTFDGGPTTGTVVYCYKGDHVGSGF